MDAEQQIQVTALIEKALVKEGARREEFEDLKFKRVYAHQTAMMELVTAKLEQIHEDIKEAKKDGKETKAQAMKTNGRVGTLEHEMSEAKDWIKELKVEQNKVKDETVLVRYITKKPKRFFSLLLLMISTSAAVGIEYGPPVIRNIPKFLENLIKVL